VNRFTDDSAPPPIAAPNFPELEARQRASLAAVKAGRNQVAVDHALVAVGHAARSSQPLMPPIIDAVRARATLGEVSDALRQAWGVYRPPA
jgi:methylmalonyl-CoA mutase N-terminal domain/subunit